jgi:hypothetical protein
MGLPLSWKNQLDDRSIKVIQCNKFLNQEESFNSKVIESNEVCIYKLEDDYRKNMVQNEKDPLATSKISGKYSRSTNFKQNNNYKDVKGLKANTLLKEDYLNEQIDEMKQFNDVKNNLLRPYNPKFKKQF